mmetsp:Transcript_57231/g.95098  ORF Transcript_57231/g.95098 Transcript_57231/m.95098 type:complete len:207 (-) Transcript_57231:1615-2235(-)
MCCTQGFNCWRQHLLVVRLHSFSASFFLRARLVYVASFHCHSHPPPVTAIETVIETATATAWRRYLYHSLHTLAVSFDTVAHYCRHQIRLVSVESHGRAHHVVHHHHHHDHTQSCPLAGLPSAKSLFGRRSHRHRHRHGHGHHGIDAKALLGHGHDHDNDHGRCDHHDLAHGHDLDRLCRRHRVHHHHRVLLGHDHVHHTLAVDSL